MRMHFEYPEGLGAYLQMTEARGTDPLVTVIRRDISLRGKLSRKVLSDYPSYYITVLSRPPRRYAFRPGDRIYADEEFLGSVRRTRTHPVCSS
ncbi:MAG: hypothetical protein QT00_C0001G0224 [archaeon GW2011_AR5]|nr:MAG: hypothetical protein QT00_C0001G0224 [archaeon GW2011_AR5]MBS3051491.1 hypothetical protein [Candidatus Aenigmarchaeota archaeon]